MKYIIIKENDPRNTPQAEWPIIIALDGEEIAGFIGTGYPNGIWVVGHFHARSAIVALRLIERYDDLVKTLGVKEYFFNIDKPNEKWLDQIRRAGINEHSEDNDTVWFKRCLNQKHQKLQ